MATYSTDLTTATTAESGTWTEFGSANSGGTPAADGENYIQGTDCHSQTTGTKSGSTNPKSVVFDNGSDLATGWTSGDVFLLWLFYAVGVNLDTYANNGHQVGIGADTTNVDRFTVGGSDYGRNPYGGWFNAAVDPELTADNTYGTGGAGYQYIGGIVYTLNAISKGTPHAVDAIRYGRGEISVTGTGGSFSEMASYNDYNGGGTPPGTSSTSVDSGRHRLGLFQDNGGTYLWKGLMSLGLTGTSVTFSDANETILVDDTAKVAAGFNKIEINNSSSSVTLTGVSITALGTTSKGQFEVVDNATVSINACTFTDMDSFTFNDGTNSNTITDTVFRRCGLITTGGATFTGCTFDDLTGAVGVTASSPANAAKISNCTFNSDGTGNGLEITGTAANFTLTNVDFDGYSTTVDANKAIYVNIASGTVNLTISGGSGISVDSDVRTAGATVNVIVGAVTAKVTAVDDGGSPVQSARVHLRASSGTGPLPYGDAVTITRSGTTATVSHTGHGLNTNDKVYIRGITDKTEDNGVQQVTVTTANAYTFTTTDSGSTSYTGSGFIINGQDETSYDNSPTSEGTFSGGTGHAVNDVISLRGGTRVTVDAVSSGAVTQFTIDSGNSVGGRSAAGVQDQVSSTGSGTGFSLTLDTDNIATQIRSTYVALDGDTDVNGEISISRVFSSNQPVSGWARKSTSAPYYKQGGVNATITSANGLDFTTVMVSDE